jgi:hypothetical protein
LSGHNPGPNPAALSKARRDRLILALRALDGRLDDATYREIASALFTHPGVSDRGWKSHDLRDRTIRLVRLGLGMMRSGYRQLLLYPYRQRTSATQHLDSFRQQAALALGNAAIMPRSRHKRGIRARHCYDESSRLKSTLIE